jgi:hypothetical protein
MNLGAVEQIAKAVLYEGYMLYPYRPSSVKNQQRWNFGVLPCRTVKHKRQWPGPQTECLVEGSSMTGLEVRGRFLQLVDRSVGELTMPVNGAGLRDPGVSPGGRLTVKHRVYQPWQEAVEREVVCRCTTSRCWDTGWCLTPLVFRQEAIRISARCR